MAELARLLPSFTAKPFLLLVGDDGAMLVPPCVKRLSPPLFVDHHDDDKAAFVAKALDAQPRAPVIILADTLAQEFRRDTLPRLNVFDKRKIMQRRLRQHFPEPAPPYRQMSAAMSLRNKEALYACLHDDGVIARWMTRLAKRGNPVLGVAPLPLVGAGLMAHLPPLTGKGWNLLLTCQRTGGFRQIVTRDGALVFTRLTPPLPQGSGPPLVFASLTLDIQATLAYLSRFGLTGETPLRVAAILPQELHKAIGTLPEPVNVVAALTPHQAAQRLCLPYSPYPDDASSDLLFAGFAATRPRLCPLMALSDKNGVLATLRFKKAGWGIASAALLLALACLGWESHGLWHLARANRAAAGTLALLQQKWNEERATLEPLTEPLGRLRQAAARQRLFAKPSPTPWPLLQTIDREVGTNGKLTRLDWRHDKDGSLPETLHFTLRLALADTSTVHEESGRQALVRRIDRLARKLRAALPDYAIAVTRYPFLIEPDESLSNAGEAQKKMAVPTADFTVRKVTS
jgi:hypothetical protein